MEKIAIIGFSCLFPDAKNPDEFWQNLIAQKDSTTSISIAELGVDPRIFFDPQKGKPDKFYSLKGAFIRNFKFDGKGYKLSADFLESLDNTFKWSLYTAQQALAHSGYLNSPEILAKCGVILGTLSLPTKYSNRLFSPIYQEALNAAIREVLDVPEFELTSLAGSNRVSAHNAMISGLPTAVISQALGLSHHHFGIDAACSSPQYAIRLASHYLWTHKTDLMLAGGVSASDPLFLRMLFSSIQGYPENNDISRPLDKSSRGLMTAEGSGMVVLKRYGDAVRDGDRIYATIAGNGLSNDGRGKHILSPNSKGQVLAFERAYTEAKIAPQQIDYVECHATGTLLGDTTEFQSMQEFFGKHQATPLIGSVKSNVGHLLTAAGAVGLIKVLLSMSKGVIPATIHVKDGMGVEGSAISRNQIVRSAKNWSGQDTVKRAAVSAFGFGGTNAHMILEQGMTSHVTQSPQPISPVAMAIVGMDGFFGCYDGLDALERCIYEGGQGFKPLPESRWYGLETQQDILKRYGFADGKPPLGAYIDTFEIDTLAYKIPPNELGKLNSQQLLMLKVADNALKDAKLTEGGNVAVLIATESEFSVHHLQQRWNLTWQLPEGLEKSGLVSHGQGVEELTAVIQDGIHPPVETGEFLSYISNVMASRISALWDFSGPSLTISAGENGVFKALEVAQHLLSTGEVEAVLVGAVDLAASLENVLLRSQAAQVNGGVHTLSFDGKSNGWLVGEGAGAIVLKRQDPHTQTHHRIYATIDAIALVQQPAPSHPLKTRLTRPDAKYVTQVCQQALQTAGVQPRDVEYLEVYASGDATENQAEITGLLAAYPGTGEKLTCAIGSIKANIGHAYGAGGMASLIKTALCLYYRYLPGTPQWSGVDDTNTLLGSNFYVNPESRPWFLGKDLRTRVAAINSMGIDGSYAHVILAEVEQTAPRPHTYLAQMPFQLFPIPGNSQADLIAGLQTLQTQLENSDSLPQVARNCFINYQNQPQAQYTLTILGRTLPELTREITAAFTGITKAFNTGEDWLTPQGSYFTPNPLGSSGGVAYVYPPALSSYIGIGRDLFRLFPQVHDDPALKSLYSLVADVSQLVFPRSLNKLTLRQLETLEKQLLDDSRAIFETDMTFAKLITLIIRDRFQVQPQFAFGYSLGETSMMAATGVWSDFSQGINAFHTSPLFGDRLSGAKNAVRDFWGLPRAESGTEDDFWSTYLLMAQKSEVEACLQGESQVYLTQINTPEEVVIAGASPACERVIKALGCNAFRAPFNHAIHCPPMRSEYGEIARLNSLPTQAVPSVKFYLSATYTNLNQPGQIIDPQLIGDSIGKGLTSTLDFPRLVNQVYADGARIFIETGSGNICSRWIDKNLENKPHIAIALNRRGADDHSSLLRALAKLVSHRVQLNLSELYTQTTTPSKTPSTKPVTIGGHRIIDQICNNNNRTHFSQIITPQIHPPISPLPESPQEKVMNNSFTPNESLEFGADSSKPTSITNPIPTHLQSLTQNNSRIHQTHTTFLKSRHEFSTQISEIIQLQLACAENLLKETRE